VAYAYKYYNAVLQHSR